ncbi:apolipoprotein D-like [Eurosta solidaginis]|uniref:apolipoprotein D-like n=1 Tax=Eurosta solidaginis TaxID=178769 RepID=UPI0035313639
MKTAILAILVLAFVCCARAQQNFPGPCPDVKVKPNFSLKSYLGIWYEYAKYLVYFESNRKCIQGEYTLQADGNLGVKNSGVNALTNVTSSTSGYAIPVENAKLKVIFPISRPTNASSNYWILDTDYTNYSVVYNCVPQANGTHHAFAWILLRKRTGTAESIINTAKQVFIKNNVSTAELVRSNQFPECEKFFVNQ